MRVVGNTGLIRGGKENLSLDAFISIVDDGAKFLIEIISENQSHEIIICTFMSVVQDENNINVALMVDTASKISVLPFSNLVAFRIKSRRYNWHSETNELIEE
jgi:hypothetical protein